MYGPGVYPDDPGARCWPASRCRASGWGKSPPEEQGRRSVYVHVKRSLLTADPRKLRLGRDRPHDAGALRHDAADAGAGMLNGEFIHEAGRHLRRRQFAREAGGERDTQVRLALAWRRRGPRHADVRRGVELIEALKTQDGV